MKKSYVHIFHQLQTQALAYPGLVDKLEQKDFHFIDDFLTWLKETESILKENNYPECALFAGQRSKLIHPLANKETGLSKRKRQQALARAVLIEARDALFKVIEPLQDRLEEAREAVNQLLGIAYQTNMIQWCEGENFNGLIQTLWTRFSASEQYKGGIAKILTLVNKTDGLRLFAEEIEL